ncbi:hypothetical protein GCM10010954_07050 [Halobacillus andaensis]|uniref:Magnesium transporter MgtE intracellular domain-containing protein n=1 Tax=Halobacillus andaensis TaxID=1176239 RepID=A0A917ETE4_HALAA|nr:hypothetical protein [Halobacillus andaensis]MBP2003492.1 flagellar motility protein MotE (MotC chaperone) [Halobacillus andaensis]GGF11024.1 hypothetical protein GCM10010954_07050 [Halobacillus andaensis]
MAKKKENKQNPVQWFFLVIVVPTVFALTLLLVVLMVMGVNVFQKAEEVASKTPIVSQWVSTTEEKDAQRETDRLEAVISENDSEIEQLEAQNSDKEAAIDELNQTIEKLEAQLESSAEDEDEEEETDRAAEMARSFQEMDEEEAAPIIENMDETLAIDLLEKINSDQRGAILGVMEAETAAELTSLITGPR